MNLDWLAKVAPTVASAMGGPLAGMAVEFVTKKLGIDAQDAAGVTQALSGGNLTSDQIARLKEAEIELQAKAQELGIRFEEIAANDRKDARAMQVATKSWVPTVLAIVVTVGFFGILAGLMSGFAEKSDALMLMLGGLGTAWTSIVAFYFGASAGDEDAKEKLYNSTPNK